MLNTLLLLLLVGSQALPYSSDAPSLTVSKAPSYAVGPLVAGVVRDAVGQPLPGAQLLLVRLPDSTVVTGTQADEEGHYELAAVSAGRYLVRARALGWQPAESLPFTLSEGQQTVMLPPLRLQAETKALREVTVTGQQQATELVDGKLVYNLDQQVSTAGSTALEVLRRAPGVSVSQNDEILLRGNANVNVMLDGKLTYLSPQQLSTYLKSTPASNLARIEVLLTPDSRYDASGNAGIINIITKKSTRRGYA
ncbi:TonB-dependent receptor [Hymenobacter cellulosilyticus]|uniref:TonB-dependent receptor n=1 Tax=Hymenobacter cellulosilyticus TaxID=2932248 RepID=A0A8T9PZN2_9BACT|nr:carboxypeptidase-like regulatory domain-containing protein [Hymenobacter cellulosilyticus]UOQ70205.1 TonB-dependent receptor [Hymenobacter cellulosilyticus]